MESETVMLESCSEDSMSIQTVNNIVSQNEQEEIETNEQFFLVTDVQDNQHRQVQVPNMNESTIIHNSDDKLSWLDLCRICANSSGHLISIFEEEGVQHELCNKIHKYLPLHISENDTLPLQLCYHCAATLLAWHELVEGCLNAQRKLLEMQSTIQQKRATYIQSSPTEELHITTHSITTGTSTNTTSISNTMESITNNQQLVVKDGGCGDSVTNDLDRFARAQKLSFATYCLSHSATLSTCNILHTTHTNLKQMDMEIINASDNVTLIEGKEDTKSCDTDKLHLSDNNSSIQDILNSDTNTQELINSSQDHLVNTGTDVVDIYAKRQYICNNCSYVFTRKHHLISHMSECEQNHNDNSFTESTSIQSIDNKYRNENSEKNFGKISQNMKSKKNNSTTIWDQCNKVKRKRFGTYPCMYCDYTAKKKKLLNAHLLESHPEFSEQKHKKLRCIDKEAVMRARMEVDGKIYYHCNECGKNLYSPYTFSWHIRIHTGERPFTCHLCGKQFRVNQGLARHLRETHAGIKNYACDLCGRMFSTKRNAEDHRRIHTGERPYVCNVCGKTFKQKASLFVHNRTHSDVFPFKCSYCEQGFRTRPSLMVHITKHTGEKPHACDICGRCFRIKYELKRHRLVHFDEKPWKCTDCNLSFRQKRYLVNHRRLNHTDSTFSTMIE